MPDLLPCLLPSPESVAENAPTVLPLALRASRFPPVPLHNHEIVFGHGRIAVRSSAQRPLGLRGRSPPRLARGAVAAAGCTPLAARATRPDGAARHPSAATGRGAWSFLPALPAAVPAASAVPCRSRALPLASVPPVALRAKGIFVRRKPPCLRLPCAIHEQSACLAQLFFLNPPIHQSRILQSA